MSDKLARDTKQTTINHVRWDPHQTDIQGFDDGK